MKETSGLIAGTAQAQDTFKIAYIDPLSGSFAIAGELGAHHFDFFADMVNAEGGLLGKKIEVVKYDSQLSAKVAVEKVRQAIADSWPRSLDDSAAREEWGWKPRYDLEQTTAEMLETLGSRVHSTR